MHALPAPQHSQCPWHAVPGLAEHFGFCGVFVHREERPPAAVHVSLLPQQVPVPVPSQMRPALLQPLETGPAGVGAICPAIRPATTAPRPPNIRRRDAPLLSAFPQTSTPRRKLWVKGEHRVGLMGRVHDVEEAVEVVDQEETVEAERFLSRVRASSSGH